MHPTPTPTATVTARGRAGVAMSSVFLSPTRAFQEIAAGASWLPPFLVCAAIALLSAVLQKPLTEAIGQAQIASMPEGQREQAAAAVGIQSTMQTVLAPAFTAIALLFGSLIFWLFLKNAGTSKLSYKRVFTGLSYALLVPSIGGLLYAFLARRKALAGEITGMSDIPRLGLDLVGGEGLLRGILSAINPFTIWWVVIVVFGFAVLLGKTPRAALGRVLPAAIVWTLVGGLFYGLGFAFSPE